MHNQETHRQEFLAPPFRAPLIVGLGQTGRLYAESYLLAGVTTQAFVHNERATENAKSVPNLSTETNLERALAGKDLIVISTPGISLYPIMEEIKRYLPGGDNGTTIMFSPNGIGYVPRACEIFKDRDDVTLVRASLFTPVDGMTYDPNKLRIAFSLAKGKHDQLLRLADLHQKAGFVTKEFDDPEHLEVVKAFYNSIGSTALVTGLTPEQTFTHPLLTKLEELAVHDRLIMMEQAGYPLIDLPWSTAKGVQQLSKLYHVPAFMQVFIRPILAKKIAKERHNLKPAARRQLEEGIKEPSELLTIPHSFISLSEKKGVDYSSQVDEAIFAMLENKSQRETVLLLSNLDSRIKELVTNVRARMNALNRETNF